MAAAGGGPSKVARAARAPGAPGVAWGVATRTLAEAAAHEDVVRGSRFTAVVAPMGDPTEAEAWVAGQRARWPDAHHVVWAWRFGDRVRWSDDGEPGGTAGRPVVEVLRKREVDRVACVVARVFGGVKLGAGGLVRAYGAAVARALDGARIVVLPDLRAFQAWAPFADADALLRLLEDAGAAHEPPGFDAAGVHVAGTVVADRAGALASRAADVTRGRVRWRWAGSDQRK